MRLWVALWTLLATAVFLAVPASAATVHCLNGLGPALVAGGFSGSVDCQRDQLSIRYVGQVRKFGRIFSVYSNRYELKPPCPECAVHGGHRVIFMSHGRYVGQYRSDFVRATIRQGDLVLVPTDPHSGEAVTVRFTRDGPPKELWVDGEVITFFR